MTIRNLTSLFAPASVALVGASRRERSVGNVLLKNLKQGGFGGRLMAVNRQADEIEGIPAYPDVSALPEAPELAVICTPPQNVPEIVEALGARGTKAAVVITAGFGELGDEGSALQTRMLEAARPHLLRIVGPNCLGLLVPRSGLNASFAHCDALEGDIAFVSQSGAVVTSVLDWATSRRIGFSHLVSLGGMADVDFGDMLDYLALDRETRGILLYVESIKDARKFMSAGRAAARLKPVIVIKVGRHAEGQKAASSHTGALAGADDVYDAAFRRAGMVRVYGLEELFDAAETLATHPDKRPLKGERLAILTNGGGIGVIATDFLIDERGRLAELAPETIERLDALLPRTWSKGNPVDIIGDAPGSRYAGAAEALLQDPNTDAVLVLNCPTAVADNVEAAEAVAVAAKRSEKPVFTSWLGDRGAREAREVFIREDIPTFETPGQAVRAFTHQVQYTRNQALMKELPPKGSSSEGGDGTEARALVQKALHEERVWLSEPEAKEVLAAYGIPVVRTLIAKDPDEAVSKARELGFPVALKILSPDITHKTDVGGVSLNLSTGDEVRSAAETMLARVGDDMPDAALMGFTVQSMVRMASPHELIAGIHTDRIFGPVVLFGHGGTAVEVVRDKAVALPPLNKAIARELIDATRISRLLKGYRGRPAADLDAIVDVLMKLGDLAADVAEIAELDINPLWAGPDGVIALDARIRVSERSQSARGERFAIRPYPADLEETLNTRDGLAVKVRPVRPDDADLLEVEVANADIDDLRMRFLSPLRRLPKALVARLTQIDYEREMAFVAFIDEAGEDLPVGVVRLVCDPNKERAEYAVIVRSDLKGKGIGYTLMAHIIDYARKTGCGEIFGEVSRDNQRMLSMASNLGFERNVVEGDPSLIEVSLPLKGEGAEHTKKAS